MVTDGKLQETQAAAVPRYDAQIEISAQERDYWPIASPATGVGEANLEYENLSRKFSWHTVADILGEEKQVLQQWFAAGYDAATDLMYFGMETWPADCQVDLGTAGAVGALNAAGCPTFTACNGECKEDYPLVGFSARARHVPLLVDVAKEAGVGLVPTPEGWLLVFSDRADGLHDFAHRMLSRSAEWTALRKKRLVRR